MGMKILIEIFFSQCRFKIGYQEVLVLKARTINEWNKLSTDYVTASSVYTIST